MNADKNPNPANRQNINNTNLIFYISFGVCLILYLSSYLTGTNDTTVDQTAAGDAHEASPHPDEAQHADDAIPKKTVVVVRPPSTPASYQRTHILPGIIDEYILSQEGCTPEDIDNEEKHKLPPPRESSSTKKNDAKSAMVIYVAVALLLMSLGATLVDFCKAKSELKKNNDNHSSRKKPALTRRCSLADLTVLRHTRKELLRKESFCGMGTLGQSGVHDQHTAGGAGNKNRKISRPPLRLD